MVVKIAREKGELSSSLSLYDGTGKQVWSKPSLTPGSQCFALVQAMAGALAFRFDPLVFAAPAVEAPQLPPLPPPALPPPPPKPEPAPAPPSHATISPPPAQSKLGFRLVAGLDGVFRPLIAPSASVGFAVWVGVDLLDLPLSFELDLRSSWSPVAARVPLTYRPHFAVRSSYVSGIFAGCWRRIVSLCPVLEVGNMSFSADNPPGGILGSQTIAAAGVRVAYERHLTGRFVFRSLFEVESLLKSASILGEAGSPVLSLNWVSFSWGMGFGGSL